MSIRAKQPDRYVSKARDKATHPEITSTFTPERIPSPPEPNHGNRSKLLKPLLDSILCRRCGRVQNPESFLQELRSRVSLDDIDLGERLDDSRHRLSDPKPYPPSV